MGCRIREGVYLESTVRALGPNPNSLKGPRLSAETSKAKKGTVDRKQKVTLIGRRRHSATSSITLDFKQWRHRLSIAESSLLEPQSTSCDSHPGSVIHAHTFLILGASMRFMALEQRFRSNIDAVSRSRSTLSSPIWNLHVLHNEASCFPSSLIIHHVYSSSSRFTDSEIYRISSLFYAHEQKKKVKNVESKTHQMKSESVRAFETLRGRVQQAFCREMATYDCCVSSF
ncbi:unnamed protein product [Lathyrus oleraceus]